MRPPIYIRNNRYTMDSLTISRVTGTKHADVVRDIIRTAKRNGIAIRVYHIEKTPVMVWVYLSDRDGLTTMHMDIDTIIANMRVSIDDMERAAKRFKSEVTRVFKLRERFGNKHIQKHHNVHVETSVRPRKKRPKPQPNQLTIFTP